MHLEWGMTMVLYGTPGGSLTRQVLLSKTLILFQTFYKFFSYLLFYWSENVKHTRLMIPWKLVVIT